MMPYKRGDVVLTHTRVTFTKESPEGREMGLLTDSVASIGPNRRTLRNRAGKAVCYLSTFRKSDTLRTAT